MPAVAPKALMDKIASLPSERIAEVEDFVDFLRLKDQDRALSRAAAAASQPASKQRPAVVVCSRAYAQERPDVVLMAITSQLKPRQQIGETWLGRWQAAGLPKPCRQAGHRHPGTGPGHREAGRARERGPGGPARRHWRDHRPTPARNGG